MHDAGEWGTDVNPREQKGVCPSITRPSHFPKKIKANFFFSRILYFPENI